MRRMMSTAAVVAVVALAAGASAAGANPSPTPGNPNGTGQPNQTCQTIEANGGQTPSDGASDSRGSVFNEAGIDSTNGGVGGNAYNNAGAPSQYDVACYQTTQHH